MFMSVDLPEPDGPTTATYSLAADVEVDAAQRLHLHAPHRVDLADSAHRDHHSYLKRFRGVDGAARRAGK